MFTRTSYSLEISTVQPVHIYMHTYVCAVSVCVCLMVAAGITYTRCNTETNRPRGCQAAAVRLCHAYAYWCVCVCVCEGEGEGWEHCICVSGRVCVYYFVFCAHKLSCDRQWKLQKRRRLTTRARCGCIRHATAPVSLSPFPLVLVNLRSLAVATVCVYVWFWLRLCVSLCSKSSLFSSYLLKPIMRSQAHLNALPPDHFILLLFCLFSFSSSPSPHPSLTLYHCCRWCCLCLVRLFLLPRVLKAFQCTRLLSAAHLKYSLQMPTQQFLANGPTDKIFMPAVT